MSLILRHRAIKSGASYSPEAQAVLDMLPNPLIAGEAEAVAAFVDALVLVDMWDKIQVFQCYWLKDTANALIDWKGNANAARVGATKIADGFQTSNGTGNYIDTNFTPSLQLSTVDGYGFGGYVKDDQMSVLFQNAFGTIDGGDNIRGRYDNTQWNYEIQNQNSVYISGQRRLANGAYLVFFKETTAKYLRLWYNDVQLTASVKSITTLNTTEFRVGYGYQFKAGAFWAFNNAFTDLTPFFNGITTLRNTLLAL